MIIPLMKNILTCRTCRLRYYLILLSIIFLLGNFYIIKSFYRTGQTNIKTIQIKTVETIIHTVPPTVPSTHKPLRTVEQIENVRSHKESFVKEEKELHKTNYPYNIGILVIACNRPSVSRCLDKLFEYKPKHIDIPVIVSQDCQGEAATANVINLYNVTHIIQPDNSEPNIEPHQNHLRGYYKIARHYKFALDKVFEVQPNIDSVIILEDDLEIAPDFFDYFLATRNLLEKDSSIMCVSAWNDIGKNNLIDVSAIDKLYRSDFFPGLGWMLTKKLWVEEFSPQWPPGFWDDWVRRKDVRKDRVCIRPEISRTKTFGKIGVSLGLFFDAHLKHIVLNSEGYPFQDYDLSYLLKDNFDRDYLEEVYGAKEHSLSDVDKEIRAEVMRITYTTKSELDMLCRKFDILVDRKDGVPRTAYRGIISFYRNNKRVYLAPKQGWEDYY